MPLEGANIQIRAPERRESTDDLFNSIARSLGRLGGGGGGGGAGGGFDYVFNPATGGYELMPHSRSNAINQFNLEQLQKFRAQQAVANDASIKEKLKDFNTMSAEKQAETIESVRTQDLPRLHQQTGIESTQLIDAALKEPGRVYAERRAAIDSTSRLGTFADTFRMGFGSFTDAIADMFSNTEEQLARAERRAESDRRIIERNPYLENRERQRAEGAGTLDLLGTGGLREASALLGTFAGSSGGPLILAGGGAGLAARAGTRLLPAAANAASQAARARAIQRLSYAGGALGGAIGGAPAQQAAVTSAIANDPTLTREEKVAALEEANTPARVVGAASGALVLPMGATVNRGLASLRASAGRGGSNVAQAVRARNAANGEIPAGASPTYWQDVIRNARASDIAAENARLTAPGWRGRWNRYRASLPDSMLESTAFGVGLNTATNVIVGNATGRDYDPFANTGEAFVSSALFGPLFNVVNTRPVRAVPEQRLDARGNVITYGRAPDGSVITSAGIRQLGEDPALPNYSYIAEASPWPPRTARDMEQASAAEQAARRARDIQIRQTVATRPDEFALSDWWPTAAVEAGSSAPVATPTGLMGGQRQVPTVVNTGEPIVGTGTPIPGVQRTSATPIVGRGETPPIRQPGMGTQNLRNKLAGMPRSFPASQHILTLANLTRGGGPLNARGNADLRRSTGAHYAEISVAPNHRTATLSALENILYNSNTQSLRNWYNNNQIDVLVGAHDALERLVAGEQNAQNGGTAGAGTRGSGGTEQTPGMGGSDVQGTGGTPDANLSPDSGEQANGAGTASALAEQLSGDIVGSGAATQERGNVVPAPQDTGANAAPEGNTVPTAEPATVPADGERGSGATTTPDAEGSTGAGSAEPATGARPGDEGLVADAGGDAESGVAPQQQRLVNDADLETLIEDAATAGGTTPHADETVAEVNPPTTAELVESATTRPGHLDAADTSNTVHAVAQLRENHDIMQSRRDVFSKEFAPTNIYSERTSNTAIERLISMLRGNNVDELIADSRGVFSSIRRNNLDQIVNEMVLPRDTSPTEMNIDYDMLKWVESTAMQNTPESRRRIFSDGEWLMLSLTYDALHRKFRESNTLTWPVAPRDPRGGLDALLATTPDGQGIGELHNAFDKVPGTRGYDSPRGVKVFVDLVRGPSDRKTSWEDHTITTLKKLTDEKIGADFLHTLVSRAALATRETYDRLFTPEQRQAMEYAYQDTRNRNSILPDDAPAQLEGWLGAWLDGRGPDVLDTSLENRATLFSRQAPAESPARTDATPEITGGREDNANPNIDVTAEQERPVGNKAAQSRRKNVPATTRMTQSEVPFQTDAEIRTDVGIMPSRADVLSDAYAPRNIRSKATAKKNIASLLDFAESTKRSDGGVPFDAALADFGSPLTSDKYTKSRALIRNITWPRNETPAKLNAQYDTLKWLEALAMQNTHTSRMRNFSDGEWRMLSDTYAALYNKFRDLGDPNRPVVDRGDDVTLDDFLAAGSDNRGIGELRNAFDKIPQHPDGRNNEAAEIFADLIRGPIDPRVTWDAHAQRTVFSRSLESVTNRADFLHTLVSRAALSTKETFDRLFTPEQRQAMDVAYQTVRNRVDLLPDNAPAHLEGWLGRWLGAGGPEVRMFTPESRAMLFPRQTTVDRPSGSVFDDGGYAPDTAGHALNTMPDNAVRSFVSRMGMYSDSQTAPIGSLRESFDMMNMPTAAVLERLDNAGAMRLLEKEAMFNYLGEGYEQLTPHEQAQVDYLHAHGVPYLRSNLDAGTIHDQVRTIEAATGEKMDFNTFYRNFLDPEDPAGPTRLANDKLRPEC